MFVMVHMVLRGGGKPYRIEFVTSEEEAQRLLTDYGQSTIKVMNMEIKS